MVRLAGRDVAHDEAVGAVELGPLLQAIDHYVLAEEELHALFWFSRRLSMQLHEVVKVQNSIMNRTLFHGQSK